MIPRACLLVLGLVTALVLGPITAAPASASDELGLSRDGVNFTSGALTAPLFDPQVRWVPGDVRTASFFVRNQAQTAGRLHVDLLLPGRDRLFETNRLYIEARAGDEPWHEARETEQLVLVDEVETPRGAVVPVQVRVSMDFEAPNSTMILATDLDLRVRLSQSRAVLDGNADAPGSADAPADTSGGNDLSGVTTGDGTTSGDAAGEQGGNTGAGLLPSTGSPRTWWLALLSLLLLGSGSFLLTLRRRPAHEQSREASS